MTESPLKRPDICQVINILMQRYAGRPDLQMRLFRMTEKELRNLYFQTGEYMRYESN
jgi:hypothetical protein